MPPWRDEGVCMDAIAREDSISPLSIWTGGIRDWTLGWVRIFQMRFEGEDAGRAIVNPAAIAPKRIHLRPCVD